MTQGTFLFLGDYLIADYDWQRRMPLFEVHTYGLAKEKVEGFLQRLSRIEDNAPTPDIILIMTGINNVIEKDYTFVDQIRRGVIRLSNRYPEAEIIVNSLPNIKVDFLVEEAIYHLNVSINEMTTQLGCCFLDNFANLATSNEMLFKKDGLNLTSKTYDKWARSILEFVAFLLEDD